MTHQTIQNIENQSQNQQGQQPQPLQTNFLSLHMSNPKSIKQAPPMTSNFPTPINLQQTLYHNFIPTFSIYIYLSKTTKQYYYYYPTISIKNFQHPQQIKTTQIRAYNHPVKSQLLSATMLELTNIQWYQVDQVTLVSVACDIQTQPFICWGHNTIWIQTH